MKTKKLTASVFVIIMLFATLLTACNINAPIFNICGNSVKTWAKNYDRSSPDTLTVYIEHDGITENPQVITGAKTINEVFDALSSMRTRGLPKRGPIEFDAAPETVIYHFRSDDGSAVSFTFMNKMLVVGDPKDAEGALYPCSGMGELFDIEGVDLSVLDRTKTDDIDINNKDNDGKGDAGDEQNDEQQQNPQEQPAIELVKYDGGFFSVMLPKGWQIVTMGKFTTFGFRAWDPNNRDFEIFSYGDLSPLVKSQGAKDFWATYINQGGYPNAGLYADAPVIDVYDAGSLFFEFDTLSALAKKYVPDFSFPVLQNLTTIKNMPLQTPYASVCTSEALLFASLQGQQSGTACHGKFTASILTSQSYIVNNVDMMPTSALNVTGVIAPQKDFAAVEGILTQAVFSLTFSDEYLRQANDSIRDAGQAALADNAAKQAVYDAAHDAWDAYIRD